MVTLASPDGNEEPTPSAALQTAAKATGRTTGWNLLPYVLRRVLVGVCHFLIAAVIGFIAWAGMEGSARPGGVHPAVRAVLILMAIGMSIVFASLGAYLIVSALSAFRVKGGTTPEETIRRFMGAWLGGILLPGNLAAAFAYLCRQKQNELGSAKKLGAAWRAFTKSLRQQYDTNSLEHDVHLVPIAPDKDQGRGPYPHVRAEVVLNMAPRSGPGETPLWRQHHMTLELVKEGDAWLISMLEGGPAEFIGKPFRTDLSDPAVKAELRLARVFILVGVVLLALTIGCFLLRTPLAGIGVLLGLASLGFLANGLAKRSRY